MGLICTLVTCPSCHRQLPPSQVIGICNECKAIECADPNHDHDEPWEQEEEDGD